ncbi:MAG TPA: glycosyltransferase family 4 protein [Chloroflexota bacterium]|nr:glycosyltransferase family 4 protein [Chloroflexota bacterium]
MRRYILDGDEMRIRVCMVTGFRPTPSGGGMEKHVYELVCGLLARDVDVQIVCEDRSHLPDPVNGLAGRIIGLPPESLDQEEPMPMDRWVPLYEEKSRRFAEMLDPSSFDIIHSHSHYGRDIALRLSAMDHRPALINTFHLTPVGQLERFRALGLPAPEGAPIDRAVSDMEATAARLSDRSIAVSHGVQREVCTYYGVPDERVPVIYNWYDPGNFDVHLRPEARDKLALDPHAPYLLYIGHFKQHRGKLMAEAMRRLPPEVRLLVIHPEGDPEIAAEFGGRILFCGYQTPEQLGLYYAAADLQCFPTVYSGFGLVLVEGMACGCPPVVFNYSAMNEIVTSDSGYIADEPTAAAYADAIRRALQDGGAKCHAAVERSRRFRMDRQIDRVVDLYREVLVQETRPIRETRSVPRLIKQQRAEGVVHD